MTSTARRALWAAAILGTVHAAWSLYWAVGGRVLLWSVGEWAVEAAETRPVFVFVVLAVVSLAKLAGAWIPLLAEIGRMPARQTWRVLAWIGGPGLVLYGGADLVVGSLVLAGWVDVEVNDRRGLIGHTFIWGPHFMVWGIALTIGLALSRRPRQQR